jgi:hypothetical protein
MSFVTNVVLLMSFAEATSFRENTGEWEIPGLDFVNAWLAQRDAHRDEKLHCVSQYDTNGKGLECHVAIGGFNFLHIEAFIAALRAAPWRAREDLQLLIKREEDDRFEMLSI